MEDDGITESERMQREYIRELDAEELEIEEVDESSDFDDYGGFAEVSESGEHTYDTSLVALHSYLGDVEDTHNRFAFLDGGAVITLPLLYLEGVVLFPEATIPLRVTIPSFIAGVERALTQVDAPYIIGIVRVFRDYDRCRITFSKTGSTAEIRQYRRLGDGSINAVASGKQRFRLTCRPKIDVEGALYGKVQIINEDLPLRMPRESLGKLAPAGYTCTQKSVQGTPLNCPQHNHDGNDFDAKSEGSFEDELSSGERKLHQSAIASWRSSDALDESSSSEDEMFPRHQEFLPETPATETSTRPTRSEYYSEIAETSRRVEGMAFSDLQPGSKIRLEKHPRSQFRDVPGAFWPSWVYRMYDSYLLAQKAADIWKQVIKEPNMESLVTKPDHLSFHIASKIPVSERTRQELLEIDGTSYRLRREIELLESFDKLRCKTCEALIAKRSDMLVMSSNGPFGAYANPHGFMHEVITLYRSDGIAVAGPPSREYSWFPGYAWSIAECMRCGMQLGWYFSATMKKLKPHGFWGIRSSQIVDEFQSKEQV